MKVVIIGGGASAMMAAIAAAECGDEVTIIEKNDKLGKKLLATGNGRCNFTNASYIPGSFFCEKGDFADLVVSNFTSEDAIRFFKKIGIWPRIEEQGRVYPYSGQASTVLECLARKVSDLPIRCLMAKKALHTDKQEERFVIELTDIKTQRVDTIMADKLIIATGGKAGEQYGSTGDGYKLAKFYGHKINKPLPALVQLMSEDTVMALPKGVRAKGTVMLYIEGKPMAEDAGEIQFTGKGISGICTFNISHMAVRAIDLGQKCEAAIDFMPETECEELVDLLKTFQSNMPYIRADEFLCGFINKKLAPVILQKSGVEKRAAISCAELTEGEITAIAAVLKEMRISIDGFASWKDAQTTSGGVTLCEVDPQTMESRLVAGLHFCGEILDVDGICGGYNLQWAWSSGYLAGRS